MCSSDLRSAVIAAVTDAVSLWRTAKPGARIYVVRSHFDRVEARAWADAFAAFGLEPRVASGGREPLVVIGPR